MASSDKPEVVEREVKDREHKEDDKDDGKGGFIDKVKDFIHDIGEKIEEAIGFGKPTADVSEIHFPKINLERADIIIDVLIKNPNPIPIPLIDINYLIESDGRKLLSGLIPDSGTIKAHGQETVKIPVSLIYDDIKTTYADIKPGSIIPYKIKVDLLIDVPVIGRITLPLEKTGEIPIPYKPDIDIEKIQFQRFSLEETVAIIHLKLENKNDFDLGLNDLDYEIWLCDVSIGSADLAKSTKLDKNGISYIDLPITFRPKDFGSAVWDMIRGKGTGYSMKGNINVDTPFGAMKLPISKEGGTTRLKKSKDNGEEEDEDEDEVDVPLEVVHLTDEYWNNVVSYVIEEYRCGRTPNPDVLCNTRIKFGAFMDAISCMKFDYVASGHYANVVHPTSEQMDKPSILELSKDMVKDQTYFLSHLSQAQIKRLVFPLGCIPKDEVRQLANMFGLPNKDRKDSQGICFLGKIRFSEFVARHMGEMVGVILEAETGDFLGEHRGFWFYTIGQRQGLRLPGGPWYVVEKDVKNNVVFVSRNYFSFDKRRRLFRVGSLKWLSGLPPNQISQLQCKVRHGPGFYKCSLTMELGEYGQEDVAVVQLSEDDQGLAAGQFAVFYQGRTCIGSGVILESWDDQGFPVCAKALEIARMEDKSKLGKPVKIKVMPETSLKESNCQDDIELDKKLVNSKIAAAGKISQAMRRETITRFTWLQKLRKKWLQIF